MQAKAVVVVEWVCGTLHTDTTGENQTCRGKRKTGDVVYKNEDLLHLLLYCCLDFGVARIWIFQLTKYAYETIPS